MYRKHIYIYLVIVSPESIVIPIVSCIFGFPILALIVICCLRHRAKMARERDRRRNYDMQDHAVSLMRFGPIHRLSECKLFYNKYIFSSSMTETLSGILGVRILGHFSLGKRITCLEKTSVLAMLYNITRKNSIVACSSVVK